MITLAGAGRDRLAIFLVDEPEDAAAVIRSLLNVRENRNQTGFFLPVHDFPILRERLDRLGITQTTGRREMDDNAALAVRSYLAALERNDRIKAGDLNDEIVADIEAGALKSPLWTDQVADVRFILRHGRVGVFSEMGVGKSLTALAGFVVLRARRLARYALVIGPNAVKQNWIRQIAQHTSMTVEELGNGRSTVLRRIKKQAARRTDVCITHYEALRSDDIRDQLVKMPFDMVILDEIHRAKNLDTDTTKAVADTLARIRPAVELVEADIELVTETGIVLTTALLPASMAIGDEVEFL